MPVVREFNSIPILPVYGTSVFEALLSTVSRRCCCLGNCQNRGPLMRSWRGFRSIRKFEKEGVHRKWRWSVFLCRCPRHFSPSTYLGQFIKIPEINSLHYLLKFRSQSTIGPIQLLDQWYFALQHRDQSLQMGQIVVYLFLWTSRST